MDGYHTNQDGQWKTSDQWRAEEANTSIRNQRNQVEENTQQSLWHQQ